MALKTKQPRFKEIAPGKMDTGGAPIFNNDLTLLQQNANADFINSAEQYRRLLPPVMYYNGPVNPAIKLHENGLILSGFTYNNVTPSTATVSPGFYLSGGEVCYYPGGTYSVGGGQKVLIYIKKALPQFTSRTFNDGISKQFTESYGSDVDVSTEGINGPIMPTMAIFPTDEIIIVSVGNNSRLRYAENYFTKEAALGINTIANKLFTESFLSVNNLNAAATIGDDDGFINFIASRVGVDGGLEIQGAVKVVSSAAAALTLFSLDSTAGTVFPASPGNIVFPASMKVASSSLWETKAARYSPFSRSVSIDAPTGGPHPNTFIAETVIYFNAKLMPAIPAAFEMPRDFLDIT